ncbi:hypothetical protein HAX54_014858 [Datura stramonium]|uniref:Uncharacterized protein n=1 Tax=Datura stramonium TaxID=4076 RepID=A0ABS8TNR5_DATST|nr:hypothetical protein [Datura stramonium]
MVPKASKGKVVASSSHGNKRSRVGQEVPNEDVSMPTTTTKALWAPLDHKERRLYTLGFNFVFNDLGDCNWNMVKKVLVNWDPKEISNQVKIIGKIVNFLRPPIEQLDTLNHSNSITRNHVTHVTRERMCLVFALMTGRPVNGSVIIKDALRRKGPRYDSKGLDVTKTKEPKGIHGLVLSISERNMRIDNHSRVLFRVGLGFVEPFNDDAIDEEQARVDSDLESDDDGDDAEMGEVAFASIDDEN